MTYEVIADCGVSRAGVELALRSARVLLATENPGLDLAVLVLRVRFLAFAALRRHAPAGRAAMQALALGFPPREAWSATARSSEFRLRGRAGLSGHWHTPARVDEIVARLAALRAEGDDPLPAEREPQPAFRYVTADTRPTRPLATRHVSAPWRPPRICAIAGDPEPGRSALAQRGGAG